jgi:N6-L-threonylcarbamoyladenine synthase
MYRDPALTNSLILGIETSCDETSCATVQDGRLVRSNVVWSQIAVHAPFGGVVPEIASRQHVKAISTVVEEALSQARTSKSDLWGVAATRGPGLAGALLVGVNFARGLAAGLSLPYVGVNHLEGHLHSVWLSRETPPAPPPPLPMLALIVSGGHTELVLMRGHGAYRVIGRTLDDAAGEAFDKVARLLGLSYPGGPSIQKAAATSSSPLTMPRAWLPGTFDFSFSGLKTAVLHRAYAEARGQSAQEIAGRPLPRADIAAELRQEQVADLAAGFQESVVDVLVRKTVDAARETGAESVGVVGGVAANALLRRRMREMVDLPLFVSPPEFSTDNAAMIAAAAYYAPPLREDLDIAPALDLPSGDGESAIPA